MKSLPTPAQFEQMLAALEDTHQPEYKQCLCAVKEVIEQLGLTDLFHTDPLLAGFLAAHLLERITKVRTDYLRS